VKQPEDNDSRRAADGRPPEYVVVLSASDWVKEHFPAAGASLWDALHTGKDRHRDPEPDLVLNHDPAPEVSAMTLTINDTTMTSDQTPHTARPAPGRQHQWEVSWLPGQTVDRNTAITAMVLADTTASQDLHEGHRLWPHIQSWAGELGLTAPDAITRISQPPSDLNRQQEQPSRSPDREAAD
jgi:hypothetical protein